MTMQKPNPYTPVISKDVHSANPGSRPTSLLKIFCTLSVFLAFAIAGQSFASDGAKHTLDLSSSERAWLKSHPEIRLAIDIDWAPFEFVDDDKHYRGMAADYIKLVEERLGVRFKIDKERPWSEMVQAVKDRDLDAFSLVVKTSQRLQYVNFTKPYISFPMVIVTRDSESFIDGIEALQNHTVGVVKSYASHDLLSKNHPKIKLSTAANVREGLKAVSSGQIYAFVDNLAVVGQVIREMGLSNLKVSGQTPYRFELSMAVRKDWPELVPILQKALDSISAEQRDKIYGRWIRVRFEEEIDYRLILLVIGAATVAFLIIYAWNTRLRREIGQRLVAEGALRESEEKYRAMFTTANVGLALCKMDGTLLEVNQEFCKILGRTEEDTLSLTYWDITPQEYEPQEAEQLASLTETGKYGPYEKEYLRFDGTRVPVLLNGSLVFGTNGETLIWSVVQDISERKKVEGEVHSAMTKAEKASRAKSEFLAAMSHDLRTPLNAIIGFADIISHQHFGEVAAKYQEYANDIQSSGHLLLSLVDEVLDLSAIEAGKKSLSKEEIEIDEIVEDCRKVLETKARNAGITLTTKVLRTDAALHADRGALKQILQNLISNAIKFTPTDGKVSLLALVSDGKAVFTIDDTGEGMASDEVRSLLEPFSKGQVDPYVAEDGWGLGLSIVKSLVELHDGELNIISNLGKGTTITVTLPVGRQ